MDLSQANQSVNDGENKVLIRTIGELKDMEKFESVFFDENFLKSIQNRDWEHFVSLKTLKNNREKELLYGNDTSRLDSKIKALTVLSEIVKSGRNKSKTPPSFEIDLSEPQKPDQLTLCYIIYFVRGKTSASFDSNPFGYIVQPQTFKDKVLGTELKIIVSKDLKVPTHSNPLF